MAKISTPTFVLSLTILGIFLGGFWFLVMPELESWGQLKVDLASLQEQASKKTQVDQKTDQEALQRTKTTANTLLPSADNQYDLSVQIEGLSKSLKVPLTSLAVTAPTPLPGAVAAPATPEDTPAKSPTNSTTVATPTPVAAQPAAALGKVSFTLNSRGTYQEMQHFVQGLTSMNRAIQIDQVSINSAATGAAASSSPTPTPSAGLTTSDQVYLQVSGFAYYLPSSSK